MLAEEPGQAALTNLQRNQFPLVQAPGNGRFQGRKSCFARGGGSSYIRRADELGFELAIGRMNDDRERHG